jgi:hypothetical protein
MQNFKTALHFRLSRGPLGPEELRKLAEAIDRAAIEIERAPPKSARCDISPGCY